MASTSNPNNLPDINAVLPLADDDRACFEDVRAVLAKHGKLDRFGVWLMHGHFDVRPDEVLLETCNAQTRTLTIQPASLATLDPASQMATSWRLDTGDSMGHCVTACHRDHDGNHHSRHTTV